MNTRITDELMNRVESFEKRIENIRQSYTSLRGINGKNKQKLKREYRGK